MPTHQHQFQLINDEAPALASSSGRQSRIIGISTTGAHYRAPP
jgi:hypothetical protein